MGTFRERHQIMEGMKFSICEVMCEDVENRLEEVTEDMFAGSPLPRVRERNRLYHFSTALMVLLSFTSWKARS